MFAVLTVLRNTFRIGRSEYRCLSKIVLLLTLWAVACLRRLVIRMFVMVGSHGRVEWFSSHHWWWRKFLLLYNTVVPLAPLLQDKHMESESDMWTQDSWPAITVSKKHFSPFWTACFEVGTDGTQVETGEVVGNASWEAMGCPLCDLSTERRGIIMNISQHQCTL